jgi:hypothetical protein
MNEGSIGDYIELQRMMYMLNQSYRSKSFNVFGSGAVADNFRKLIVRHEKHNAPELGVDRTGGERSLPVVV